MNAKTIALTTLQKAPQPEQGSLLRTTGYLVFNEQGNFSLALSQQKKTPVLALEPTDGETLTRFIALVFPVDTEAKDYDATQQAPDTDSAQRQITVQGHFTDGILTDATIVTSASKTKRKTSDEQPA